MARITIKMIAERCGLSPSTVAYILREPDTCIAKQKTKDLVLTTAKDMGYRGNFAAHALRTQQYKALGILLPWTFGHYGELVMALDKAMKQVGYHGIYSFWEGENFTDALQKLCNQGVDAIITAHSGDELKNSWKPIITYEDYSDGCDCVFCDKIAAMHEAMDFLTKQGYTKFGFLGLKFDNRFAALLSELRARNMTLCPEWFVETPQCTVSNGYNAMQTLLKQKERPQIIITHSDLIAQGCINAAFNNVNIPKQIGILSFDNLEWSGKAQIPLTTFDRCYDQTAQLLVQTALERLADPKLPPIFKTSPLKLTIRQSVTIHD